MALHPLNSSALNSSLVKPYSTYYLYMKLRYRYFFHIVFAESRYRSQYFSLCNELLLFFQDVVALETLPVLGYSIEDVGKVGMFSCLLF